LWVITYKNSLNASAHILRVVLRLFAAKGYDATTTLRIAKAADVSEGLIFRHFGSKQGLLEAILAQLLQRMQQLLGPILMETEPRRVIEKYLALPFEIPESEYDYWQLQFRLKWDPAYFQPEKLKPLKDKLTETYRTLGYADPELEAQLLIQVTDGVATDLLRKQIADPVAYRSFVLSTFSPR